MISENFGSVFPACLYLRSRERYGSVPCTTLMLWSMMSWASAVETS